MSSMLIARELSCQETAYIVAYHVARRVDTLHSDVLVEAAHGIPRRRTPMPRHRVYALSIRDRRKRSMSNVMGRSKMLIVAIWVLCGLSLHINAANAQSSRTISIPARALSFASSDTTITPDAIGLRWRRNFRSTARFFIRRPRDYAGGNVTFRIFFRTTSATSGVVDFFIRPDSFDPREGFTDTSSLGAPGARVAGSAGFAPYMSSPLRFPPLG